ncbi:MAG: hypothetical protein M1816_007780 [Peltula sp. TS41687]|nr:MAG: hypothetical protein M1816_007780 [Peltula sp. TS41687]
MSAQYVHRVDSDTDRTPSESEKVEVMLKSGALDAELPPDPDAGLSAEEKARIGNAKIEGLLGDLHMTERQYNATLTIFFVSYAIFEPLTNVLLKRFRPRVFIPATMILWGVTMTCMGLVHNFSGLMAARWFLGLTEAGLFPGVSYYLSCWYRRSEFGIRIAIFFSAAAVAGSFGGLLAAAISKMKGIGGKPGWAWIFILEGIATVIIGIISYWMVHDFPDEARFLTEEDKLRVLRRLKADNQSSAEHEEFRMAYFWASVKDFKTWTSVLIYMGAVTPLYSFSLFLPSILRDLGYSSVRAQLLSVPPYAVACLFTVMVGYLADRTRQRGVFNIGFSLIGIAGFGMLLGGNTPAVRYAGTYLAAVGIYPTVANTISWIGNNVEGTYKRGVSIGLMIGGGNLNGVVSSNIYRGKDSPRYRPGHIVVMAYLIICMFGGSVLQRFLLQRENAKRRAGKLDGWFEGKSDEEVKVLGDKR